MSPTEEARSTSSYKGGSGTRVLTASNEDENKKPADSTLKEFSNLGQKESVDQFLKVFDVMLKKDFDGGLPLKD